MTTSGTRRGGAWRRLRLPLMGGVLLSGSACVQLFWRTDTREVSPPATATGATVLRTPLRAHLRDGGTVVLPDGGTVSARYLTGDGQRYRLLSNVPERDARRLTIPMDSVIGVETFDRHLQVAPTVVATAAATAVGAAAGVGLWVAIFGSCPTLYTDTSAHALPEAEGFSYAISPLLERRDVDALRVQADRDGVVRLELRNEALETHFLNQLTLTAVTRGATEVVVPDQGNRPVALSALQPVALAVDREGRDVRTVLALADDSLYRTAASRVASAREGDLDDWISLETGELPPGDSVAVLLRLRNSLLTTVLLYDGMLGGPDALQWMARGTTHLSKLMGLASWYTQTMGLRVMVEGMARDGLPSTVATARLGDVGPIAFREVAVVLPRPAAPSNRLRVRLQFVVDNWRIDQVQVSGVMRRPDVTQIPVARVIVPTPVGGGAALEDTTARGALQAVDTRYLETRPGQRLRLEFETPRTAGDSATQYLVTWHGWYREWLRSAWLTDSTRRQTDFVPGDRAVLTAIRRWQAQQPEFERAFHASRIPVR